MKNLTPRQIDVIIESLDYHAIGCEESMTSYYDGYDKDRPKMTKYVQEIQNIIKLLKANPPETKCRDCIMHRKEYEQLYCPLHYPARE